MFIKHLIICFTILLSTALSSFLSENEIWTKDLPPKGFGPYYVKVRYHNHCQLSPIDVKNFVPIEIIYKETNKTNEIIGGRATAFTTHKVMKVRLTPIVLRNGVKVTTYNKTSSSPCNDLLFSFILAKFFNVEKDCIVKKGNYTFNPINLNEIFHKIVGNNFIYDRVQTYYETFTKYGCVSCINSVYDTLPLPKLKKLKKKNM